MTSVAYAFAHHYLRDVFFNDPMRLLAVLAEGGDGFLHFGWGRVEANLDLTAPSEGLAFQGLRIAERACAIVILPPPQEMAEAHFVALTCDTGEEPAPRMITLERSLDLAAGTTAAVLGEWSPNGHDSLGLGPSPDVESFLAALREMFSN